MVAQGGRAGVLGRIVFVEAEILLRGVREQAGEYLGSGKGLVELLSVRDHDQRTVVGWKLTINGRHSLILPAYG